MLETKCLIVGGGVAGLFMAYEMARLGERDFLILEQGEELSNREYAIAHLPREEAGAAIVYGVGGAGLFSDGKLNFSPRIGGDILTVLSQPLYQELTDFSIQEFDFEVLQPNTDAQEKLESELFLGADWELIPVPQAHIGSDHLPNFVRRLTHAFQEQILYGHQVISIEPAEQGFIASTQGETFHCQRLIIAVGQASFDFAERIARQFRLTVQQGPADLGIRVEVPHQLWEPMVEVQWDPKVYWHTPNGSVRTFCTNPQGFVVGEYKERYLKGFFSVNGHAKRDTHSTYTNFALMLRVPEDQPNTYLVNICDSIAEANQNKLLVQRVDDFLAGCPTQSLQGLEPTSNEYVPGDIASYYPEAVCTSYRQVLRSIAESFPDFLSSGSLLYAPEVKLYSNLIKVEANTFESEQQGLFFIGDSCGYIHGLTNAMFSGLACARYCALVPKMA